MEERSLSMERGIWKTTDPNEQPPPLPHPFPSFFMNLLEQKVHRFTEV